MTAARKVSRERAVQIRTEEAVRHLSQGLIKLKKFRAAGLDPVRFSMQLALAELRGLMTGPVGRRRLLYIHELEGRSR